MRVAIFSTKPYDKRFFDEANQRLIDNGGPSAGHEIGYFESRLTVESVSIAFGIPAVCVFTNDEVDPQVLSMLSGGGTKLVALRCAGFNNTNLAEAARLGITIARVPAYSPNAVAEHTIGLMLALNRKFYRAHTRVRECSFELEGLLGFNLHGKTVGVIGTGRIGAIVSQILTGFGCRVLLNDPRPNQSITNYGAEYVALDTLFNESDVITLHCPLTPETNHIINHEALSKTKRGVMLVNTSRGALIDPAAALDALKAGQLGFLGLDIYEEESDFFFHDLSGKVIPGEFSSQLMTFPNALITGHQAFFTTEAMTAIAETTLNNLTTFERGEPLGLNEVTIDMIR